MKMRGFAAALLVAVFGMASAEDMDIPILSPQERDTGSTDTSTCYVVPYSGIYCSGTPGKMIPITESVDGACIELAGHQSYSVSAGCPDLFYNFWTDEDCKDQQPEYTSAAPGCNNISGSGYKSFSLQKPNSN